MYHLREFRRGYLQISAGELMKMLGLEGGVIHSVSKGDVLDSIRLEVEHPRMPLIREAEVLQIIGLEQLKEGR